MNASCSLLTELAPYVLREELIFNYPILCICPSLIQKKKKKSRRKKSHTRWKSCSKSDQAVNNRSIHLSDSRCWLFESSQLWQQLKSRFHTSCQSLKHSSCILWERAALCTHVWKKIPAGKVQQPEIECLRELGFRSHCSLSYFHCQGNAPAQCSSLIIPILCTCFHEFYREDALLGP